jgi:hypothetical protein
MAEDEEATAEDAEPGEFPSDWHRERHLEDLEREVTGRLNRLGELEDRGAHPDEIAQAEAEVEAAQGELARLGGKGHQQAEKRPRTASEKRASPTKK